LSRCGGCGGGEKTLNWGWAWKCQNEAHSDSRSGVFSKKVGN
jgi:hypothetical protein